MSDPVSHFSRTKIGTAEQWFIDYLRSRAPAVPASGADDCPDDFSGIRPFVEPETTRLLMENAELKRRLERTEAMLARHFMGGVICCQQDGEAA